MARRQAAPTPRALTRELTGRRQAGGSSRASPWRRREQFAVLLGSRSNLLEILAACKDISPYAAAKPLGTYSALKSEVTDAVIEVLRPMREQAHTLLDDPAELERLRMRGAENARRRARDRLEGALRMSGLR